MTVTNQENLAATKIAAWWRGLYHRVIYNGPGQDLRYVFVRIAASPTEHKAATKIAAWWKGWLFRDMWFLERHSNEMPDSCCGISPNYNKHLMERECDFTEPDEEDEFYNVTYCVWCDNEVDTDVLYKCTECDDCILCEYCAETWPLPPDLQQYVSITNNSRIRPWYGGADSVWCECVNCRGCWGRRSNCCGTYLYHDNTCNCTFTNLIQVNPNHLDI
jgi:hypothetical protein